MVFFNVRFLHSKTGTNEIEIYIYNSQDKIYQKYHINERKYNKYNMARTLFYMDDKNEQVIPTKFSQLTPGQHYHDTRDPKVDQLENMLRDNIHKHKTFVTKVNIYLILFFHLYCLIYISRF